MDGEVRTRRTRAGDRDQPHRSTHHAVAEQVRGPGAQRSTHRAAGSRRRRGSGVAQTEDEDGRHEERDGVDGKSSPSSDEHEQHTAERVAQHDRSLDGDPGQRERIAVAVLWDDVAQGGGSGCLERRSGQAGEERKEEQRSDRQVEEHGPEQRGAGDVGDEHHRDAPKAVGQRGQHLTDADEAGQRHRGHGGRPGGRPRALQHDDGQGKAASPIAEQRQHVGGPEASEVAHLQGRHQRAEPTPRGPAFLPRHRRNLRRDDPPHKVHHCP